MPRLHIFLCREILYTLLSTDDKARNRMLRTGGKRGGLDTEKGTRIKDKILCRHLVQIEASPSSCSLQRVQRLGRAVWVPSPPSVPLLPKRERPSSALQTYLRENLFLKALIVFAIIGAISAKKKEKKNTTESNKKSLHMKAKVRAESNSKLQPWQTRVFERGPSEFSGHRLRRRRCFLHCTNTDPCLNPPCSFPRELHSNSEQLDRHRAAKTEVLPHCYH